MLFAIFIAIFFRYSLIFCEKSENQSLWMQTAVWQEYSAAVAPYLFPVGYIYLG
jgi:hypothetical protein